MTRSRWPDRVTRGDVTNGDVEGGDEDEVSDSPSALLSVSSDDKTVVASWPSLLARISERSKTWTSFSLEATARWSAYREESVPSAESAKCVGCHTRLCMSFWKVLRVARR